MSDIRERVATALAVADGHDAASVERDADGTEFGPYWKQADAVLSVLRYTEMREALEADLMLFEVICNILSPEDLYPHISMKVVENRRDAARAALKGGEHE